MPQSIPKGLTAEHVRFALSELDYFVGVTKSAENADLAYRYLVDHTAWFVSHAGTGLLRRIQAAFGA